MPIVLTGVANEKDMESVNSLVFPIENLPNPLVTSKLNAAAFLKIEEGKGGCKG